MKNDKLTRRQLAGALLATSAAAAAAQTPVPSTPDADLEAAREQNQHSADQLAAAQFPITAEPAFHFTA